MHRDHHRLRIWRSGVAALMSFGFATGGGAAAHAAVPGARVIDGGLHSLLDPVRSTLPALAARESAPTQARVPAGHPSVHAAPEAASCASALDGSLQPFTAHLEYAHLERRVPDQIEDIKATNRYVLTHTVLVQAMVAPLQEGALEVFDRTPGPLFTHVKFAHLERSPFEQVADIEATDQYIETHAALAEAIAAPAGKVVGACG